MEEWKDIPGYEGKYQVSSIGRVKSLDYLRTGKEMILKRGISKYGYSYVTLSINGIRYPKYIHRLVAEHFIPNPNNLPYVLHKGEMLDENRALYNGEDNLFWGTQKDNMQDMIMKGRDNNNFKTKKYNKGKFGKDHHSSIPINQYLKSGEFIREWGSTMDIERELGINHANISTCCRGKVKSVGGFVWKY